MADAFIYDHLRTPRGRGKVDGSLHEVTALNLAAQALAASASATRSIPSWSMTWCWAASIRSARRAATSRAPPPSRPAMATACRACRSTASAPPGLDAVNFAAAQIMSGQHDMAIGGGVESMSRVGIGASGGAWPVDPAIALPSYFMPQGVSADLIATKYGFSRAEVDGYAVESQKRAAMAWDEGRFARSVLAVKDSNGLTILAKDEHMRPSTSMQSLAQLQPSFVQMGEMGGFDAVAMQAHPEIEAVNHVHHAGNSSGIVDGAAAVLLGSQGGRPRRQAHAARAHQGLRQCGLGAGPDADRPGRRHPQGAQAGRA